MCCYSFANITTFRFGMNREMGICLTSAGDVVKGGIGDRGIAEGVGPCAIANANEKKRERMNGFPGGKEIIRVAETARSGPTAPHGCWGNARFAPITYRPSSFVELKAQNVRDKIQQGSGNHTVPSQGWSHQAHAGRSTLRAHPRFFFLVCQSLSRHTPKPAVLQLLQARCVLRGAITGHLGPHFPGAFRI